MMICLRRISSSCSDGTHHGNASGAASSVPCFGEINCRLYSPSQQSWKWREAPRRAPTARLHRRCQYYALETMTICPDRSRPNHDNLSDMWCKKSLLWRTKTARKETRWPAFFRFRKAWKIFLTCDFSTILKYYAMDLGSHHRMTSTGLAS